MLETYERLGMKYRPETYDLETIKGAVGSCKNLPIGSEDICLDIGSHIGTFAIMYAEEARSIVCFEPGPDNYEVLQQNIEHLPNVSAFPVAITDGSTETVQLYLNPGIAKGNHTLVRIRGKTPVTVPSRSLRAVIDHFQATVLKIDIEAGEYHLPDLGSLPSDVRVVAIEYHLGGFVPKAVAIHEAFLTQGFTVLREPKFNPKLRHTHALYERETDV